MKHCSIREIYVYVLGTQLHVHKPSSAGEGRLHAAFVNLVPMEMAASVHCVESCTVRGGQLKWKGTEKGEGLKK